MGMTEKEAKAKLKSVFDQHPNSFPEDQLEKITDFFAKNQDLFPEDQLARTFQGLPPDPEFGTLSPRSRDTLLEMIVECPPWGIQTLKITLYKLDGISPATRSLLRLIQRKWLQIWQQSLADWDREYPGESDALRNTAREWVVGAELRARFVEAITPFARRFPAFAVWHLSISGNAGVRVLALTFRGAKMISSELI